MFINKHLQSLNFPQISSFWKRLVFFVYNLTSVLLPRQFPFTGPTKEFTTLRAWVFLQKSWQFGFSLTLRLCRWHPKNFSKGSWQNFSLRNDFTPGMLKRYGTRSRKECTRRETTYLQYNKIWFLSGMHIPHPWINLSQNHTFYFQVASNQP